MPWGRKGIFEPNRPPGVRGTQGETCPWVEILLMADMHWIMPLFKHLISKEL